MDTTEVIQLYQCDGDDFFFKASRIHQNGQFTGITKIERRFGPIEIPAAIRYAFHGGVYMTLEDAMKEYKRIGRQGDTKGGR